MDGKQVLKSVNRPKSAGELSVADEATSSLDDIARPLTSKHSLAPIVPIPRLPAGSLNVESSCYRLVYLAPIPSLEEVKAKRLYRNKANLQMETNDDPTSQELHLPLFDLNQGEVDKNRSRYRIKTRPLLKNKRRTGRKKKAVSTEGSQEMEMKRFKAKLSYLPSTDVELEEFWGMIQELKARRARLHAVEANDELSPVILRRKLACDKAWRDQLHREWMQLHHSRMQSCLERKKYEDELYHQRVLASTTEHRIKVRLLQEQREQYLIRMHYILPIIYTCSFSSILLANLKRHYVNKRLCHCLRMLVHVWRKRRASQSANEVSARILRHWLKKSVAVQSVSLRVFRGIRLYIRRVKILQMIWRAKRAKRELRYRLAESLWLKEETKMVEAAILEYQNEKAKEGNDRYVRSRARRNLSKRGNARKRWLAFVPENIRKQVIWDYLSQMEREYVARFRKQEEELFPHLVQTLRCNNPTKSREYIRALAANIIRQGKVFQTLEKIPGAVDELDAITPSDIRQSPVVKLIREGRKLWPQGAM